MAVTSTLGRQLATFVEIKPATNTTLRAAESTIAAGLTVLSLSLLFGWQYALVGFSGAFIAFTGWDRPLLSRAKILLQLGLVYLVSVTAGVLVAGRPVLTVLVLGVVGLVVTFWHHAVISDPPGPMLLIAGAAFATRLPDTITPLSYVLVVLAGMVVSSTVCLLFQSPVRRTPLREAMTAVSDAVTALERADRDCQDQQAIARLRNAAFAQHFHAQEVLVQSTVWDHPGTHLRQLDLQLHLLHVRLIQAVCRQELPWARIEVKALLDLPYLGAPSTRYMFRWALSSASMPWLAARRMGVAITLTGICVLLLGAAQPSWAIMTTAIVLSFGADRASTTHRAAHRVVGTIGGLLIYLLIASFEPGPGWTIALVLVFVFAMQMLAPRNFALASMAITPMALLMFSQANTAIPAAELVGIRMAETLLGVASALLVLWLTGSQTPVALVRRQFRRALRALERTLDLYTAGQGRSPEGFSARRNLHFEQLACVQILEQARSDRPRTLSGYPQIEATVSDLTHIVLTAGWTEDPAETIDSDAMTRELRGYLSSLPPVSTRAIDAGRALVSLTRVLQVGRAGRPSGVSTDPPGQPGESQ